MTKPKLKIQKAPKTYNLDPEKLKGAPQSILPYLFGSNLHYTEDYEYFDLVKPYLDIPEPRKSIEEIQQELDEKFDVLIARTIGKFEYSKESAEIRYDREFDRIIGNFEYARKNGEFMPKLTLGYGIGLSAASYEQSFVIKQGNKHEGYYTFGNRKYFKYYMPDKPSMIVRFFMRTCLGFYWVDEKSD